MMEFAVLSHDLKTDRCIIFGWKRQGKLFNCLDYSFRISTKNGSTKVN